MTAIEQLIETAKKQTLELVNASFDVLLEKVRANVDFLSDMNATNDAEPQADYEVAYVATPAEIPDLEGINPVYHGVEMTKEQHKTFVEPTATTQEKPLVQEVKERFDLEAKHSRQPEKKSLIEVLFEQQDKPEWKVVETESDLFKSVCTWIINGEKDTAYPVIDARLFFMQEQKKVRFTKKDFDHIQNLMWWRCELIKGKDGDFSLKDILTQHSTFDWEKPLWEALAKTIK